MARNEWGVVLVLCAVGLVLVAGIALVIAGARARRPGAASRFFADRRLFAGVVAAVSALAILAATAAMLFL